MEQSQPNLINNFACGSTDVVLRDLHVRVTHSVGILLRIDLTPHTASSYNPAVWSRAKRYKTCIRAICTDLG